MRAAASSAQGTGFEVLLVALLLLLILAGLL